MESVIEFKLPVLGENIEQGDLVRLLVAPGAAVTEGQAVMELETDKAVVEVPSSVSGTIKEILVKEGDKIKVGQVIFTAENGTSAAAEMPRQTPALQKPSISSPAQPLESPQPSSQPQQPESPVAPRRNRSTDAAAATEFRLQELGENISEGDL